MSSVSIHTTHAPSHSHTLAPGPVITSGMLSPSPSAPASSSIVTGTPGGMPPVSVGSSTARGTPTATPSTPSSAGPAVSTFTQKKLALALALTVFLPAVINAL